MNNEPKQMSLSQCSKHDKEKNLSSIVTGWGLVSKERTGKGISRADKIRTGLGKSKLMRHMTNPSMR